MAVFMTMEDEVLKRVQKSDGGILQKEFSNTELGIVRRLCEYPNNWTQRPKLMTIHTSAGSKIILYPKHGAKGR
jgi:hypothetical protein